jgi:hypothetical protein
LVLESFRDAPQPLSAARLAEGLAQRKGLDLDALRAEAAATCAALA